MNLLEKCDAIREEHHKDQSQWTNTAFKECAKHICDRVPNLNPKIASDVELVLDVISKQMYHSLFKPIIAFRGMSQEELVELVDIERMRPYVLSRQEAKIKAEREVCRHKVRGGLVKNNGRFRCLECAGRIKEPTDEPASGPVEVIDFDAIKKSRWISHEMKQAIWRQMGYET